MKPAQKVLIIFIALLVAEVASQKGEEIPQCCCSSKYPHRTLQTAPEYNLRFLVSILPMKYPAKFFFRLMTRLPKESVRPMMAHYKELREMNAALDAKLRLPPLSNYDIADLRYCQEVPPDSNRRLLVQQDFKSYKSSRFPFPSEAGGYPLPYQKGSELEDRHINNVMKLLKPGQDNSTSNTDNLYTRLFSLIRDSVTTYNDANIEVIEHLCRRGYKAFLRKEISNTGPYDPNLGDPLLIRLMTQPLPQVDGLDQEVFERWMAMFIEAIYGQDHFEYLMCPDTGSVCDTKC